MLQLKNITKTYITGNLKQDALKNVSVSFRKNEFVSILGHSGSGKTTMLNIIGGLDHATSGDLIINGVSTKKYKSKDWDAYRNESIGFVFQSYNLIPHQSILSNVELALTISGMAKKERRKKAKEALELVGLAEHIHKKPNQLSGGQMQRVAIARALINNPDILLADEPTGALDSDTSIQVMQILKSIAQDRLVIMVTHNPDLANEYSNRIIKLVDGQITDDSNPYESHTELIAKPVRKRNKSMSFLTSFSLSLNNLLTKKLRTFMTSFAGSIGIMGIALILSVSNGVNRYIDDVQENALSSYPLTIEAETTDISSLLSATNKAVDNIEKSDKDVTEFQIVAGMFAEIGNNNISKFKDYLLKNGQEVMEGINAITYKYGIAPDIYTNNFDYGITQVNPSTILSNYFSLTVDIMSFSGQGVFSEMMDDYDLLNQQYKVLAGRWPEKYDEIILVLAQEGVMNDFMTYSLGLRDPNELKTMISDMLSGKSVDYLNEVKSWNYDELLQLRYKLVNSCDYYRYNADYDVYEDMSNDEEYMKQLISKGLELKVVGIVTAKDSSAGAALTSGMAYTHDLTEYIVNKAKESEIVKKQLSNNTKDVFSSRTFEDIKNDKNNQTINFEDMISIDQKKIAQAFGSSVSEEDIKNIMMSSIAKVSQSINVDSKEQKEEFSLSLSKIIMKMLNDFFEDNKKEVFADLTNPEDLAKLAIVQDQTSNEMQKQQALNSLLNKYATRDKTSLTKICDLPAVISIQNMTTIGSNYLPTDLINSESDILNAKYGIPKETLEQALTGLALNMPQVVFTDKAISNGVDIEDLQATIVGKTEQELMSLAMSNQNVGKYFMTTIQINNSNDIEELTSSFLKNQTIDLSINQMAQGLLTAKLNKEIITEMSTMGTTLITTMGSAMTVDPEMIASAFSFTMNEDEISRLIEAYMNPQEDASYNSNLSKLGYADLSKPTGMSIYLKDFEAKENFLSFLNDYNSKMKEEGHDEDVIIYTDITGILMGSVKTIIDAISYVLIAFVAISLIVSSIMIAVITLISVMERTKEIGILRAIGASKRDISHVFNVETFIIGLLSGFIGVGGSLLLLIPINKILLNLTGLENLQAYLQPLSCVILCVISVILTLVAGIIPSSSASKKDPVEALRTE